MAREKSDLEKRVCRQSLQRRMERGIVFGMADFSSVVVLVGGVCSSIRDSLACVQVHHMRRRGEEKARTRHIQGHIGRTIRLRISTHNPPTCPAVMPSERIIRERLLTEPTPLYTRVVFPGNNRLFQCPRLRLRPRHHTTKNAIPPATTTAALLATDGRRWIRK